MRNTILFLLIDYSKYGGLKQKTHKHRPVQYWINQRLQFVFAVRTGVELGK